MNSTPPRFSGRWKGLMIALLAIATTALLRAHISQTPYPGKANGGASSGRAGGGNGNNGFG